MKIDADSIGFVLGLQTLVGITTAYWVVGGMPVEPTRQAVAVTEGIPPIYVRPLIWDGQRIRRMGPGDVIDPAIKALFT